MGILQKNRLLRSVKKIWRNFDFQDLGACQFFSSFMTVMPLKKFSGSREIKKNQRCC